MNVADKVKPKVERVIRRFPTQAKIYREEYDKYKEPLGEVLKFEVTGFFHEENYKTNFRLEDKGVTISNAPAKFLMVLINEETKGIKKGDILYLCDADGNRIDNDRFEIMDLGDLNRMGIYYDLNLKEV